MRKKLITNVHRSIDDITYTDVYKRGVLKGTFMTDRSKGFKKYTWNISTTGYVYRTDYKTKTRILLHRYLTNYSYTDHINRNRLDNRSRNLREVTPQQNSFNRSFNKFGVPNGIHPKLNRWHVSLTRNGYTHNIGLFDDLLDAVLARQEAELRYFGDMASNYNDFIIWLKQSKSTK